MNHRDVCKNAGPFVSFLRLVRRDEFRCPSEKTARIRDNESSSSINKSYEARCINETRAGERSREGVIAVKWSKDTSDGLAYQNYHYRPLLPPLHGESAVRLLSCISDFSTTVSSVCTSTSTTQLRATMITRIK